MSKKIIICLDGGGQRGANTTIPILRHIEDLTGKRIFELCDMVAGTSTGSIIAGMLVATKNGNDPVMSLEELEDSYVENGKIIFPKSNWFKSAWNKIASMNNAYYSNKPLKKLLYKYFGNLTLKNTLKELLIPSINGAGSDNIYFRTRGLHTQEKNFINANLADACLASSAAAPMLSAYRFLYNNNIKLGIDGGVIANNPSLFALIDAIHGFKEEREDFKVLSIGTGRFSESLSSKKIGWFNALMNTSKAIDISMQHLSQGYDDYCNRLLGYDNDYLRLQVEIDDKKYCSFTDSSKETRDHLLELTQRQIIDNQDISDKIKMFFAEV